MRAEAVGLGAIDWADVVARLVDDGWVRLPQAIAGRACARLVGAAPLMWLDQPEHEVGAVREAGMTCGQPVQNAAADVRNVARVIHEAISAALPPDLPPLPVFNEAQWGRARADRSMFITPHRDPPGAGGVIAICTLYGHAPFRVWHGGADPRRSGPETLPITSWDTMDGDLVLLRGRAWPTKDALCPVHEVGSPRTGDRMILTLRHNRGGPGADYFAY